jgi:uncharacterized membrane protein
LTRNNFVTAAIGVAILILVLAFTSPTVIRIALALALILFLPGYGLTAVLFPRQALDLPARLLLSVGLSLTTTALSGLILHMTPAGISLHNPWIILLIGGPAVLGLYSLIREVIQTSRTSTSSHIGFTSRQVLLFLLAAAITVTALTVARMPTSPKNLVGYTLFWVQAGNVPDRLEVGVQSEEFKTTEFQIRFEIKDVTHDGPIFKLTPGQTWNYSLQLNGEDLAGQPVTVLLYRLDKPNTVYRRVVWWHETN